MNLYIDPWIPVRNGSCPIGLKELLCGSEVWQLSLPRDDMELACLQLLISLVQVALPPSDRNTWRQRLGAPLSEAEYDAAVEPLMDWFDLDHTEYPFMQTRGVNSNDVLPIQKLLIGLPAGNNHSFFNRPGEVRHVGASAAAIALFNQAVNAPGISSGLEVGLRKAAVVTLVSGPDVRSVIWRNVLHLETIRKLFPVQFSDTEQKPNWVRNPVVGERAESLGLLRGLFWQPKCIELVAVDVAGDCDIMGNHQEKLYVGFKWKKQSIKAEGFWQHPHTPSRLRIEKGKSDQTYLSFTSARPSWEHCLNFISSCSSDQAGESAAPVVEQWRTDITIERLSLLVGGYCRPKSNEEKIVARRHELYSIGEGWQDEQGQISIQLAIEAGTKVKDLLAEQLKFVADDNRRLEVKRKSPRKTVGSPINRVGESRFYERTEFLIHDWLKSMRRSERKAQRIQLFSELSRVSKEIFNELTEPYCGNPSLVRTVALARVELNKGLRKMKEIVES